jgi:fumarate reductase flavoprotein subunit
LDKRKKIAFNIFDERLAVLGRGFDDFNKAEESGALIKANSIEELASKISVEPATFRKTLAKCEQYAGGDQVDPFGRNFEPRKRLTAPYYAVKVTGALFHTQGGLRVNRNAQICRPNGVPFDTIFACGGAACGVSGPDVSGYLSGNGLLTALSLGQIAGSKAGIMTSRSY